MPRGPFQSAPDTPALPSIFLYVWSGVDNPSSRCKDAVIVVDFTPDSETFGRVVNVATTPFHGSEPHHVGLVANGSVLATGGIQVRVWGLGVAGQAPGCHQLEGASCCSPTRGAALASTPPHTPLQSYLRGLPDIFLFNVSNARAPQYFKSVDPPLVRQGQRGIYRLLPTAGRSPCAPPAVSSARRHALHPPALRSPPSQTLSSASLTAASSSRRWGTPSADPPAASRASAPVRRRATERAHAVMPPVAPALVALARPCRARAMPLLPVSLLQAPSGMW